MRANKVIVSFLLVIATLSYASADWKQIEEELQQNNGMIKVSIDDNSSSSSDSGDNVERQEQTITKLVGDWLKDQEGIDLKFLQAITTDEVTSVHHLPFPPSSTHLLAKAAGQTDTIWIMAHAICMGFLKRK